MSAERQQFLDQYDVSRETLERLDALAELVAHWSRRINLVSRSTLPHLWGRHFADSAQLFHLVPRQVTQWADLGSGGGFPALVVAVLSCEKKSVQAMTLVESDQRKAAFLRTAIRELALPAIVIADRIERVPPIGADVLSARALASLDTLLAFASRHMSADGVALFPKGASHAQELETALERWRFRCETHVSRTDPSAVIFSVSEIQRV